MEQERREKQKQLAIRKRSRKVKQKLITSANETPIFDEKMLNDHPLLHQASTKLTKVVNAIASIIKPLIDSEKDDKTPGTNGETTETETKTGKKNKKGNGNGEENNKQENGNEEVNNKNQDNENTNDDNKEINGFKGDNKDEDKKSQKKKNKKKKLEVNNAIENNNNSQLDANKENINDSNANKEIDSINHIKPIKKVEATKQIVAAKQIEPTKQVDATKQAEATKQIKSTKQAKATKQADDTKQAEAINQADPSKKAEETKKIEAKNKVDSTKQAVTIEQGKATKQIKATDNDESSEQVEATNKDEATKKVEVNNEGDNTNETNTHKENGDEAAASNGEPSKKKKKKSDKNNDKSKMFGSTSMYGFGVDNKSNGKERKLNALIDIPILEKHLNELHRLAERFDKNLMDKVMFQRLRGLRLLGNILELADRGEFSEQAQTKLVATTSNIIGRVIGACTATAAYLITTDVCVHIVALLAKQLDKDLTDSREMYLAKQLADCVALSLDSVLVSTRVYEENQAVEERPLLAALRGRAHMLISYLCLSGCVGSAERGYEARESLQSLLTVCADLCHPCDADLGVERTSATQSLRVALSPGVGGSRAELCGLFAAGARLPRATGAGAANAAGARFVRAARTAHLLRALADLDHHIVQDAFGEGNWPLEFRAAVARLLAQHAPSDKDVPRSAVYREAHMTMVMDLIVLVGYVLINNQQMQDTILDGWTVVRILCTLPANWLVSPSHSAALLPTLAVLAERPSTAAEIARHVNLKVIEEYMESEEAQKVRLVQLLKQSKVKKGNKK
ncbi:hypothetical protein ACJJTC_007278 [Scirpophaga incertulas]